MSYIIGKAFSWRSQILIITMIRHSHLKLYNPKHQTLKQVEVIKVSDKPTCHTSLEKLSVGDHRF